ncbi:MAG: hypothetical protein INR62_12165, partial [Rhodospirillales bacterium]|nr:hypothetical protein [Acetobacter sp.]
MKVTKPGKAGSTRRWPSWRTLQRSLQVRILGVHAVGLVVASALTLGTVNLLLQVRARAIVHQVLVDQAAGIIQGLHLDPAEQLWIDYADTTLAQGGRNTFAFVVRDAANHVRLSSINAPVERLARLRRSRQPRFLVLRKNGPVLSTVTRSFALDGQQFWIVVAWNLSAPGTVFDNILDGFLVYSTLATLMLLAILLGIDLLVMRNSLRPMLRVMQAVRLSHRHDNEFRLSLDELPNEILHLARAYNEALDKAETAY